MTTPSTVYSSRDQISAFIAKVAETASLQRRPMFVLDLDGNVMVAYKTIDGKPLENGLPENQNIPFNASIETLLNEGKIKPAIFGKGMDSRLSASLATALNQLIDNGRPFDIAILTSRDLETAELLMKQSGIHNPKRLSLFADSGATAYVDGKRLEIYTMSDAEKDFLKALPDLKDRLDTVIDEHISQLGLNPVGRPELFFEKKNIATNIHWRSILDHFNEKENGSLDKHLSSAIDNVLVEYLKHSPTEDGTPIFAVEAAPCAFEIKIASINKGTGLQKIIQIAKEHGVQPSCLVYAGDDICKIIKEERMPGTDYHAFATGPAIAEKEGFPFFGIHTLHPADNELRGLDADPMLSMPDTNKSVLPMSGHILVQPTITTHSALSTCQIVLDVLDLVKNKLVGERLGSSPRNAAAQR